MKQNGFVLFVVLLFLVLISLLGSSMFVGINEGTAMVNAFREKGRAFDAALMPLFYTESWLGVTTNVYTTSWNAGSNCSGAYSSPVVCNNALTTPTDYTSWPAHVTYDIAGKTGNTVAVSTTGTTTTTVGGVTTTNSDIVYQAPLYYIYCLSTSVTTPPTALYQVTVAAYGGNANAVAVVQGVYQVQVSSRDIGG